MSMNVNSTEISSLLQLFPMAIPGAETDLLPAGAYHLGIPQSIHSPSMDLFMVIDPLTTLATTLEVGDSVRLWVNGEATSVIKIIRPGQENARIIMELPWRGLKDGLNTLWYEVTRISGNKDKSDPILNVLFNYPASGITASHPPSISPGQRATFTITRSYPREYDAVTLTVGKWSKTIPYRHPANPITYTLSTTDIQQIGDGTHPVNATVVDQLSNRNASPTTTIVIKSIEANPPTLTSVKDLSGWEIPDNGYTVHQEVTVSGTAPAGQEVEVFVDSLAQGKARAATNSAWSLPLSGLTLDVLHSIKAVGQYGANPSSNVRRLTVVFGQRPAITAAHDSSGIAIADGGTTIETAVTLTGAAAKGQQVEVFDGAVSKGKASTNASTGIWTLTVSELSAELHSFTVKALYGSGAVSARRTLTVIADLWRDSVTDFSNGTAGGWAIGSAGRYGRIAAGQFQHDTAVGITGFAGTVFSQTFMFTAGRTYSFSIDIRNNGPVARLLPSFSVALSSGQTILPVATVPKSGQWIRREATFSVSQMGNQTISIVSHQDRGSGSGSDGGNDYQIDNIIVRRLA